MWLMIILSVKSSELSPDQWRLKARIVFRGDDIRDQSGIMVCSSLMASLPVTPCEPTLRPDSKPSIAPMFYYRLSSSHQTRNFSINRLSTRRFTDILKVLPIGINISMRFCLN